VPKRLGTLLSHGAFHGHERVVQTGDVDTNECTARRPLLDVITATIRAFQRSTTPPNSDVDCVKTWKRRKPCRGAETSFGTLRGIDPRPAKADEVWKSTQVESRVLGPR
jgi:hypothetical protein